MRSMANAALRLSWKVVPFKPIIKPFVHRMMMSRAMPGCWLRSLRLFRILNFEYGYLKSAAAMRSIDAAGNPLPWITYPAIEFLKQLDLSDKTVFEYGCGGGAPLFWGGPRPPPTPPGQQTVCPPGRAAPPRGTRPSLS